MPKTISIHDQEFEVSTPYDEGHILTEIEAGVLNQTRAENVSNNFRKRIKEALESENPDAAMAELRTAFAEYDASYEFGAVRASAATMTPFEKECERQARAWLVGKLREAKTTLKAYTESKGEEFVADKVAEIAQNAAIQKLAKDALKEAEKRANAAVGVDLDEATPESNPETEAAA